MSHKLLPAPHWTHLKQAPAPGLCTATPTEIPPILSVKKSQSLEKALCCAITCLLWSQGCRCRQALCTPGAAQAVSGKAVTSVSIRQQDAGRTHAIEYRPMCWPENYKYMHKYILQYITTIIAGKPSSFEKGE